jgi:hypothetical protein
MRPPVEALEVGGQGRDLHRGAALLEQGGQLGERLHVVGAEHRQDRFVAEEGAVRLANRLEPSADLSRHVQEVGAVLVPVREVLGADGRSVRRLPLEHVGIDLRGDATPDDRLLDSGEPQDLGHLRHVAEHVRQVPDRHRAAELRAAPLPVLEVPEDRLARDQELVHQHLPRPDREAPLFDQAADSRLRLGPHLEVVVDGGELSVEREPVAGVGLHGIEQPVDQPDESQPEALEREVPLAVPVRVGDKVDGRQAADSSA